MVEAPAATGVISPDDSSMVATSKLPLVHVPPETSLSKVVVPFEHKAVSPLKVPALKGAVTVTSNVAVALAQPPKPVTVYVIVDVPDASAVMSPEETLIIAVLVSDEDHDPSESLSEIKVVVPFEHIVCVPLKVPALTGAVIVNNLVAVATSQPPEPDTV